MLHLHSKFPVSHPNIDYLSDIENLYAELLGFICIIGLAGEDVNVHRVPLCVNYDMTLLNDLDNGIAIRELGGSRPPYGGHLDMVNQLSYLLLDSLNG
jgi:hypothetical protein